MRLGERVRKKSTRSARSVWNRRESRDWRETSSYRPGEGSGSWEPGRTKALGVLQHSGTGFDG